MDYRIIDTHCHPQFPQYDADREQVIQRSLDKGIGMICVGTDLDTSRSAIELATRYQGLYASVGLHPNDELGVVYDEQEYERLAAHPKVVAIGEVGLDYFRTADEASRLKQRDRLVMQLAMARRCTLPVIIHCRDAHDDMRGLLTREGRDMGIVIHSFNGTVEQARAYLDEGFYIGLNAIVTYAPQYDDMVRYIAADRLLLETDAPYLAPAPYRGKRNEPLYIEGVGNSIAAIRSVHPKELFHATTANACKLFSSIK